MAAVARGRPATLAVRADVALASESGLAELLRALPGCGLTVWAHPGDPVCPEAFRGLLRALADTGPVWLDVPDAMISASLT